MAGDEAKSLGKKSIETSDIIIAAMKDKDILKVMMKVADPTEIILKEEENNSSDLEVRNLIEISILIMTSLFVLM
jgi:hypothetical protein